MSGFIEAFCAICKVQYLVVAAYCRLLAASLPHLVDFDWSVNVHTSANDQSQASAVPTCRLHLQVYVQI